MAKSSTPTTQTTTPILSPGQEELLQLSMPGFRQFAASVPQRYGSSTIAGFNPTQTEAQQTALGATGTQQQISDASTQALLGQLGGTNVNLPSHPFQDDFWNPANNPMLQGAITSATRPIMQNLTENVLPQIRSGAVGAGQYGGSRQGIAEGLASRGAEQAIGDTAANLAQSTYGTNVNALLGQYTSDQNAALGSARLNSDAIRSALGLSPTIQSETLAPSQTQAGVGDAQQQLAQALLSEQVGNFNYDQLAPFLQSKELASIVGGLPGGGATTTGSVPRTSPFTSALGGAAAGASLGSIFGPWGTGIGAIGGGLTGLLAR